mmetsp:Transcript_39653/g.128320  ORF Transcript_39653/g.128320 Transcript_39653/m.128320 type:complete len:200 (+) Transcript_39653:811-1410(+)
MGARAGRGSLVCRAVARLPLLVAVHAALLALGVRMRSLTAARGHLFDPHNRFRAHPPRCAREPDVHSKLPESHHRVGRLSDSADADRPTGGSHRHLHCVPPPRRWLCRGHLRHQVDPHLHGRRGQGDQRRPFRLRYPLPGPHRTSLARRAPGERDVRLLQHHLLRHSYRDPDRHYPCVPHFRGARHCHVRLRRHAAPHR